MPAKEQHKVPPHPDRALIDPAGCIGCAKCLPACPVDAILGTRQQLHAVLQQACTGCGLCLPPCPTNCITLVPVSPGFAWPRTPSDDQTAAHVFLASQSRMEALRIARKAARQAREHEAREEPYISPPSDPDDLRRALQAARERARKPGPRAPRGTQA